MVVLIAKNTVKEGLQQEFLKLAKEMTVKTRQEKGCISYDLASDQSDAKKQRAAPESPACMMTAQSAAFRQPSRLVTRQARRFPSSCSTQAPKAIQKSQATL